MRIPIAISVLLLGCSPGPVGPQGPAGPPGPVGAAGDAVMLLALAQRVAELEARPRAKVPHLVHAETGEDFGVMLDWQTVWNEGIGAPVVVASAGVLFADADCKGEARIAWISPRAVTTPDGSIVRAIGRASDFRSASRLDAEIGCRNVNGMDVGAVFEAMGDMLPPARPEKIVAALR